MRRIQRRPKLRPMTDEEIRRDLAARLVGTRIALGLTPQEMLDHIGHTYERAERKEKRGLSQEKWQIYKLALIENELAEGRLSTIQRYTRALHIGAHIQVTLYGPEVRRQLLKRKMRQIATRKPNRQRRRSPLL